MSIGTVHLLRHRTFTFAQLEATYKKLADLGYDGPEACMGGKAGIPWEEEWQLIKKYNLKVANVHGDINNPDELKKKADIMGVNVIGISGGIPGDMMNSVDGFMAYVERVNNWAKIYKGYTLIYHHHAKEFVNFPLMNGKSGMQILLDEFDNSVGFEIDTFWASCAGADPAQWILKVKNRIPVVHFKDYAIDWKGLHKDQFNCQRFAEIGQGNINWPAVVDACRQAGVQWYCVEQDHTTIDEFESLKISINYMRGLGIK